MDIQAPIMRKASLHLQYRRKMRAAVLAVSVASSLFASSDTVRAQSMTPGGVKLAKPSTVPVPSFGTSSIQNVRVLEQGAAPNVTKSASTGLDAPRYGEADDIRTAAIMPRVTPGNLTPSSAIHDGSVLGTVPIRVSGLAVSPRWQAIMAAEPGRVFTAECSAQLARCNTALR